MMRLFYALSLLLCLNAGKAAAQDTLKCNEKYFNDPLLDKLTGNWHLTGTIGKRTVENHFSARWILNHQFIELNFEDAAQPATYFAKVSIGYDCVSERYVAHWLDNFGGRFSETLGYGVKKNNAIEFRFEYPDGPFINVFSYNAATDGWQLHLTTKSSKGEWVVWADEYLKRR